MENKRPVKLISQEGFEFIVDYDAACVSNTVKNMLSSQGEGLGKLWGAEGARGRGLMPGSPHSGLAGLAAWTQVALRRLRPRRSGSLRSRHPFLRKCASTSTTSFGTRIREWQALTCSLFPHCLAWLDGGICVCCAAERARISRSLKSTQRWR
jgi:hypothetical protein